MGSSAQVSWWRRLGPKIVFPSIVLLAVFAIMVILNFFATYTASMEADIAERLRNHSTRINRWLHEEEERIALHARFMSDMVSLSEQLSGIAAGSSVLIYMLEYLKQEQVETHIYTESNDVEDPYHETVRKGMLGIRTTALVARETEHGLTLGIAGASPIERVGGIQEVVVTSFELDHERLLSLEDKIGAEVSIIHGGQVVESSIASQECRALLGERVAAISRPAGPGHREPLILDLDCQDDPRTMIVSPLEIGYEDDTLCALSLSLRDQLAARSQILRNTVLTATAVLLGVILAYSLIVQRITLPLKRLSDMTRRVGAREFDAAIHVESRDEVGELARSFNTMTSRLAESEREVERLHLKEMERADRLATIGELASGIAHEIRNPLAGISGAMSVLRSDHDEGRERAELLDEVSKQIGRMKKLTQDLLAYSRPSVPRFTDTRVNEILDSAIYLVTMGEESAAVEIETRYDPDLPAIHVDPEQVQQVFLNILLNAVQASPGSGKVSVTTRSHTANGESWVTVEITDDGVGMPETTIKNALRPFFTTKHKGTGLGLSIAHEIVETHHGKMKIESEPGQGTTFTLSFPV